MQKSTILIRKLAWDVLLCVKDFLSNTFLSQYHYVKPSQSLGCSYLMIQITVKNYIQTLVTSIIIKIIFDLTNLISFER